jgi:hypothetical protein
METEATRNASKLTKIAPSKHKAIAALERTRSPLPQTMQIRSMTIMTVNSKFAQLAISTEHSPLGVQVLMRSELLGTIETYPVWGINDEGYQAAKQLGLESRDHCYMVGNHPHKDLDKAVAEVVANWLVTPTISLPDYF